MKMEQAFESKESRQNNYIGSNKCRREDDRKEIWLKGRNLENIAQTFVI